MCKVKTKNIKMIEVSDWDKLVSETYGKIYSFQQQDGCKSRGVEFIKIPNDEAFDFENASIPEIINDGEIGVSFKSWLARDSSAPLNSTTEELNESGYYWGNTEADETAYKEDKHHIELFWERSFYPHVVLI